jgi:hypothetical protein
MAPGLPAPGDLERLAAPTCPHRKTQRGDSAEPSRPCGLSDHDVQGSREGNEGRDGSPETADRPGTAATAADSKITAHRNGS